VSLAALAMPKCIIIAGPNGVGKTTFAHQYLLRDAEVVHFVNVDLIASGISPLKPEIANRTAGRLFLQELDRLASEKRDFAFETTLSGLTYVHRIKSWKAQGYRIEIIYLRVGSARLAVRRIAIRVRQGGHFVPDEDVFRRFDRSWNNFVSIYQPLADYWGVYDNTGKEPKLIESIHGRPKH
jgi:predicted ABC-type ATPase